MTTTTTAVDRAKTVMKDWFVLIVFFSILVILTIVTVVYAKEAEQEAREVRRELAELNVTAQNRCMVQVVLSYPPPVAKEEFSKVLADFDLCILTETSAPQVNE